MTSASSILPNTVIKLFRLLALLSMVCLHANDRVVHASSSLPIVPGLVGFGVDTPAGSGRHSDLPLTRVFRVTNLNANGQGSLQECIYAAGPRTCVFEVSGTIDLTGDKSYDGSAVINLKKPYITIAGQTAPSPGVMIKGKTLRIEAHDVLIQHLRFRVGDSTNMSIPPGVRDTILIAGNHKDIKRTPHNIVIDHCSLSWGIDEVVSIKDSAHHITLSNNIISEGLDRSLHPKGRHSKGLMAVGNYQTIYRNLFAHLNDRAPLDFSPNSVIVNNLSYNSKYANFWSLSRSAYYASKRYSRATDLVSNLRLRGANTNDRGKNIYAKLTKGLSEKSLFYVRKNYCSDNHGKLIECGLENSESHLADKPSNLDSSMDIWPATGLKGLLLANVGARPIDRDSVDLRIVNEVHTDSGRVPNCVDEVDKFYPIGTLTGASGSSVLIDLPNCYNGRFEGQKISVTTSGGQPESRLVVKHQCGANGNSNLTLANPWSSSITKGLTYKILNSCASHAGGWPELLLHQRALELPANPNEVLASGYTRLEEYLHAMAKAVEVQ